MDWDRLAWRPQRRGLKPQWLHHMWGKYRLDEDTFYAILDRQGGRCANHGCDVVFEEKVVGRKWNLQVDHDNACCPIVQTDEGPRGYPTCGRCTRGFLCANCNIALGHAKDDVQRLLGLASYLVKNLEDHVSAAATLQAAADHSRGQAAGF